MLSKKSVINDKIENLKSRLNASNIIKEDIFYNSLYFNKGPT